MTHLVDIYQATASLATAQAAAFQRRLTLAPETRANTNICNIDYR